jgi:hypothetical protein
VKQLIALRKGIEQAFPDHAQLVIDGKVRGKAEVLAMIDAELAPIDLVVEKRAERDAAIEDRNAKRLDRARFIAMVEAGIVAWCGRANPDLRQFGLNPVKDDFTLTAEEAQKRFQKGKETKKKRGTWGKRKKKRPPPGDPSS